MIMIIIWKLFLWSLSGILLRAQIVKVVTQRNDNEVSLPWCSTTPSYTNKWIWHHTGVIMGAIASQIPSLTIFYSTVYLEAGQRKHQSSASLAFEQAPVRGPVNSPHKWPVTRKMFPFDDVIMVSHFTSWKDSMPYVMLSVVLSSRWVSARKT